MTGADAGFFASITARDLVVGLAIALILEALLWGIIPDTMRRIMVEAAHAPSEALRTAALFVGLVGITILWLVL